MTRVQLPSVAGIFYPADPQTLQADVDSMLQAAAAAEAPPPKALIAPHAGYIYSGPVAASVYARLRGLPIQRVVCIAPSHRYPLRGVATSSADFFRTPLGDIAVDQTAVAQLRELPQVTLLDQAFAGEHALEVQLPFLQRVLGDFRLVPLLAGDVTAEAVAEALECVWGGPETLIVISSDLSHFHDYRTAQNLDAATTRAIEQLAPEHIDYEDACGRNGINGLLLVARRRGLRAQTLDLRNSGDTAGDRQRVVGYGAYEFH